jgi:hypothetical protein
MPLTRNQQTAKILDQIRELAKQPPDAQTCERIVLLCTIAIVDLWASDELEKLG